MVTYADVRSNNAIREYIKRADESLAALGFTDHSFAHVTRVAVTASYILEQLGFDEHDIEIVKIAGYLHDTQGSPFPHCQLPCRDAPRRSEAR